jgi:hypothetical protein
MPKRAPRATSRRRRRAGAAHRAHTARCLYTITASTTRRSSLAGHTASRPPARTPHAHCRLSGRAVRAPSPRPCVAPTHPGPADRATWHACAPLGPPDGPCTLLPRICSGAAPRRSSASAVAAAQSSLVHTAVHRPCSSSRAVEASTRTPWTLLCTCFVRSTRLLTGSAVVAADRHLPRHRPSPELFPAEPTPPSDRG